MENEPWMDEARNDLVYTSRLMRMPKCLCCNEHIASEQCLSLRDAGLNGYLCQRCIDRHTIYTDDLEV